ncbi:MAG: class I SAM-dependent methyltransferase [Lautropia sp.]
MSQSTEPTIDDVEWSYKTLLNRPPESQAVIDRHLRHQNMRDLIQQIVRSEEFVSASKPLSKDLIQRYPLNLPRTRIDIHLGRSDMAAAIAKVKSTWTQLGESAAHHSVLTNDKFRPENLDQSISAFWESGEREAGMALDLFRHHGIDPKHKICVEYGCGVGRVTAALARHFGQVCAYDISANHLAHAQKRFDEIGISNGRLVECSETFLEDLLPCDALYSRIVFQHNPPPIILEMIKLSVRALKANGIAIFQVPIYKAGYTFDANEWLQSPHRQMEMHCIPQPEVFAAIAAERGLVLEVREDGATGSDRFISNTFVVRKLY